MDMDKRGRALGWIGLIGGGVASVAANVRSLWIPERVDGVDWRTLPERTPDDFGAFFMALFLPLCALVAVEMVNHWTHLHRALRFGVLGAVAVAALASSFYHVVTVFMWYGQNVVLAVLGTASVDGLMILSGLALFTRTKDKDKDMDNLSEPDPEPLSEEDKAVLSSPVPDTVPDMDTLPPAPERPAPRQRAPRPDPAWKVRALEIMAEDPGLPASKVAEKVMAEFPGIWPTPEAGRKAVSRLR
jgi:hypothetical protein